LPSNHFVVYAPGGLNVMDQASYEQSTFLPNGVVPGTGNPLLYNKSQRQPSIMASVITQFINGATDHNTIDDGTTATLLADFISALKSISGQRYTFDAGSPPATPIDLNPGDMLVITHSGRTSIPLHLTTEPGIYKMNWTITGTTSTDNNVILNPNGLVYGSSSMAAWGIEASDSTHSASPPYLDPFPASYAFTAGYMLLDAFQGPSPPDTGNDIGPLTMDMTVSTYTIAKMVQYRSGTAGGGALGFSLWQDTVTPWTSMGTLSLANTPVVNGTVVIERLA
jgi:hypothetical protein